MANVLDFECNEYPEDLLLDIFKHQHKLAEKYIPIEKSNGLCLYEELPADIDNAKAQARIKDMTWRAVEETAEAFEALLKNEMVHFHEELADALHFLVEKYLLCDFLPTRKGESQRMFSRDTEPTDLSSFFVKDEVDIQLIENEDIPHLLLLLLADFTINSGLTCNCLKNKPWKQTQMMTDVAKFRLLLQDEFESFILLCNVAGFDEKSLYNMYVRKNQVNQFRQRSNY